eukprot:PITA_11198
MAPVNMREGKIPEQKKTDNGSLFPKVITPVVVHEQCYYSHDEELGAVLESVRKEKEWFQKELQETGALLFRGFKCIKFASDFNAFVDAFGWEEKSIEARGSKLPATRSFEGYNDQKVWFNYIPGAVYKKAASYNRLLCGDGSAIPSAVMEESARVMDNECVEVKWEAGDVLLIDNLAVMHARRPSKPPRRVWVALCE